MKKDCEELRERLWKAWKSAFLTKGAMAKDIGISYGTFSRFINGFNKISMSSYLRILDWVDYRESL